MKTLFLVGGTMGVGKTTVCQQLKRLLPNSVYLDGDWCWDMSPFHVTEETKDMVMENICFLLNQFLRCSVLQHVIFSWVMHEQGIIDGILSRLELGRYQVKAVSLVCDEKALVSRLRKDIAHGVREQDVIERSVERLSRYQSLNTVKIDVSHLSPEQAARAIAGL